MHVSRFIVAIRASLSKFVGYSLAIVSYMVATPANGNTQRKLRPLQIIL